MPGHNHYADCACGWCLKYGRSRPAKVLYWGGVSTPSFGSYASFTIPNASCPVCGASVYFYQSPTGGRVFFDELGPPWPKHPCTDNSSAPVARLTTTTSPGRSIPRWRRDGWEPIRIRSSRLENNWHVIPVENLITRVFFSALADTPIRVEGETCAFMKPWDRHGLSCISFVNLDSSADEALIPIFERKQFFRSSRGDAKARREKIER